MSAEQRPKGTPTVKIDNERVRVTQWHFVPGAETGHHRHEYDYIVLPLSSGNLRIVDNEGAETLSALAIGEPYFRPAGVEHNVINTNSQEFTFIEVELLQPGSA